MQTRTEFVARNATPEQIARKVGADKVIYQPLENLKKAVQKSNPKLGHFCAACFDGAYPTGGVTAEIIQEIEKERWEKQPELNIQRFFSILFVSGAKDPKDRIDCLKFIAS